MNLQLRIVQSLLVSLIQTFSQFNAAVEMPPRAMSRAAAARESAQQSAPRTTWIDCLSERTC
jgi:hypothetical protein